MIDKKESANHQPPRSCEVQYQQCSEKNLTQLAARCHVGKANDHCSWSKKNRMKRLGKKDGKTRKMDTYLDTKSERRFLLIGWLMGVEQNSVYLSRILVVGCVGLSYCEKLVGANHSS